MRMIGGFLIGVVIDILLIMYLLEPFFKSSVQYIHKKEKEREQQNIF